LANNAYCWPLKTRCNMFLLNYEMDIGAYIEYFSSAYQSFIWADGQIIDGWLFYRKLT
jgi:hypothetical protein